MSTLYERMIAAACSLDRRPAPEEFRQPPNGKAHDPATDGDRPGDLFNARATWAEILGPHGWQFVYERGELSFWKRPGKTVPGISASAGIRSTCGKDLLHVFTTNGGALSDDMNYSKFGAYTALNHNGDYSAAAKALRAEGYCQPDPFANAELHIAQVIAGTNEHHTANGQTTAPAAPVLGFPPPIPASKLKLSGGATWLWHGYLARGGITLFSALWKAGKTTLLAHLLREMERGGTFCGLPLAAGRVLYVTEESEHRWAERRDELGLHDHIEFLVRPFGAKPDGAQWKSFLGYLGDLQAAKPADLIVFDTLSNLWPVRDENDAPQVQAALMPLHKITETASLALIHHNRKGDGTEATAARGSGALAAFVDTIMEFRRYEPKNRQDRRRVLTGYGRYEDTPGELVIELTPDGYVAQGDRRDTGRRELSEVVVGMLPERPGLTIEEIRAEWPDGPPPPKDTLRDALNDGAEHGLWFRTGSGKRGDPHRYGSI